MKAVASDALESATGLSPEARNALRDLLLALADNKRILGLRYADWMLGAPSLETGIAASSMAQDEWGHARLTYALLADFGADPRLLEHEREAAEYHSMEPLDGKLASWVEMIAAALLLDTALSVQYGALVESRYTPVRNRVQKLLDEETFHFQYAAGWVDRMATSAAREPLRDALARLLPMALRWLGDGQADGLGRLQDEGVVREGPDGLRTQLLQCVAPVLEGSGLAEEVGLRREAGGWALAAPLVWEGWSESRRRAAAGGPDADTLARARGDRNRSMLVE